MGNASRFFSALVLTAALTPLAFAQGVTANYAAEIAPGGGVQIADVQPLPIPLPENDECYNNGPLFNSPGTGPGGTDQSILQGDENLFGWGAQISATNTMADDYTAQAGCTDIKGAVFYMYQTGATSPSINAANVTVYQGTPGTGTVVCSSSTLAGPVTFTNTYRVTSTAPDTARRLQRVEVDFSSGCSLTAGQTYWFAISAGGTLTSGPWQPPVPRPLGSTTCPGPTNGAGAQQSTTGGPFAPAFTDGISCQSDMPFSLLGTDVGCDIKFLSSDLSYNNTTRTLTIDVTVRNNGTASQTAFLSLDYNRNGGAPQGTRLLGSGTLPAGAQASRTINLRIPPIAPDGQYNFTLNLEDGVGTTCGTYSESFNVSAPRMGETSSNAVDGSLFEASAAVAGVGVSPNPFVGRTEVTFSLEASAPVTLAVYDVLGRQVAVLVDGELEAGAHSASFDASSLAPGVYVYRLTVGNDVQTGRMTLAH